MEKNISTNRLISELTRSSHGSYADYVPMAQHAITTDPAFFAHLIAWNHKRGQIRDSKVALPVINIVKKRLHKMYAGDEDEGSELVENAFAALASLPPIELAKAVRFFKSFPNKVNSREFKRVIEEYLRLRERNRNWWNKTVMQHRQAMKELYALNHIKPDEHANNILFKGKKYGVFSVIPSLPGLSDADAAMAIVKHKIPFLVAASSLGKRMKSPEVLSAIIDQMSPTELVTNTKMLTKFGVMDYPITRAAFELKLAEAAGSKQNILKTSKAADQFKDGSVMSKKLKAVQEKQLDNSSIEGDWLILADMSGSMHTAIEAAKHIAATLARFAGGKVHLAFFDTEVIYYDMTGLTLDEIKTKTKHVRPRGATSVGIGLQYARQRNLDYDGIVVVSDGHENTRPLFRDQYQILTNERDVELPVYFYNMGPQSNSLIDSMRGSINPLEVFDIPRSIDYYSLPNLVTTMRTNKFSLKDEIMETPLLTMAGVLRLNT